MDGGFLDVSDNDDIIRLKNDTFYYGGRVLAVCGLLLGFNLWQGMEIKLGLEMGKKVGVLGKRQIRAICYNFDVELPCCLDWWGE